MYVYVIYKRGEREKERRRKKESEKESEREREKEREREIDFEIFIPEMNKPFNNNISRHVIGSVHVFCVARMKISEARGSSIY